MRRHRRLVISERVIPFLAAFVGLLALLGAVIAEMDGRHRAELLSAELARVQQSLDGLALQVEGGAAQAGDDGVAAALLALQERIERLEQVGARPAEPLAASGPTPAASTPVDPNLPTTDCIPVGTRFMGVSGESYPICQSTVVVRIEAVTGDSVVVAGTGAIAETTAATLPDSTCTLMVFSAEIEGFAEMRVACQ